MTFLYVQATGALYRDGERIATGYSGAGKVIGDGRNNPRMEAVRGKGPIPRGFWVIGDAYKHNNLGPVCMNLDPIGHDALGRSAFRIHGDNLASDASQGCIILAREIRELIAAGKDRIVQVI